MFDFPRVTYDGGEGMDAWASGVPAPRSPQPQCAQDPGSKTRVRVLESKFHGQLDWIHTTS